MHRQTGWHASLAWSRCMHSSGGMESHRESGKWVREENIWIKYQKWFISSCVNSEASSAASACFSINNARWWKNSAFDSMADKRSLLSTRIYLVKLDFKCLSIAAQPSSVNRYRYLCSAWCLATNESDAANENIISRLGRLLALCGKR